MYSNVLKILTFTIITIVFGIIGYLYFFYLKIQNLQLFLSGDIESLTVFIQQVVLTFAVPVMLLFSYIMRSIDWSYKHHSGGFVWIIGSILNVASIVLIMQIKTNAFFVVYFLAGYIICMLATFVPQNFFGSDNKSGISGNERTGWEDVGSFHSLDTGGTCTHGECL